MTDSDNRDAILAACSFASTHDADEPTTLKSYVERMKDGQDDIYFMTGESRQAIEDSPHMEAFRAKGVEVLLLTDAMDEVWVDAVKKYEGKSAAFGGQGVRSTSVAPRTTRVTPRRTRRARSTPGCSAG